MGLIARIKQLFKKQEEEESKKTEEEPKETEKEETVESVDESVKLEIETKPLIETEQAIKNWEKTLQTAQQHPLSQVKIINTQILEELSNVLKSMDSKLDNLHKLDMVLEILMQSKAELDKKGVRSEHLESAISQIERLTIKDKEVLEWIDKQDRVTAEQLAGFINLSRSTASFRLNRLADLGALEKEAIGKKIYYKMKKD